MLIHFSETRPLDIHVADGSGGSRVNSPCSSDSGGSTHHLGPKKKFLALHHTSSDSNIEQSGELPGMFSSTATHLGYLYCFCIHFI